MQHHKLEYREIRMHFFANGSVLRFLARTVRTAIVLLAILLHVDAKEKLCVELIAFGGRSTANYAQLTYLGPPMSVAVDYVNKAYNESMNVTLKYVFDDMPWANMVSNEYTGRLASRWYYRERNPNILSVFLIPAGIITPDLTYIFQQWNVLFLTLTSLTPEINDRIANPTWISTARLNYPATTMLFCEVLCKYNWSTFMIVVQLASSDLYRIFGDQIAKDSVHRMGRAPLLRKINVTSSYDFLPLLTDIRAHTRIVIFLGPGGAVRDFLVAAYKENMTNGDYVYLAFELMDSNKVYGRMHWEYHDDKDKIAQQAFQSLLIMRLADIYEIPNKDLAEAFMAHSQRDFNYTYAVEDFPYLQMIGAYGAVTTLAEVMDNLWTDGYAHPYHNGTYLARHFFNRTFNNNAIPIYIDDRGGRQMDLYLWRFEENGRTNKFLYKRAVGNAPVIEMYQMQRWVHHPWPPPNVPLCGYKSDHAGCTVEGKAFSAVSVAVPIVTAVCMAITLAAVCQIRRIKQKTLITWWKIDESRLESVRSMSPFDTSFQSNLERKSLTIQAVHLSDKFVSAKLNGIPVIIEIGEKTPEETFNRITSHPIFLGEMNKMRNFNHQNIARMYGISTIYAKTHPAIGIIMEQPARGCIYDVFDGLISLDMTLIGSLMSDFLEGVQFIHSSALSYHGSLCGLYCHVDKNFTLKISGLVNSRLRYAVHGGSEGGTSMPAYFPFCTKRETLSVVFNQKADMYDAGVVLWELLVKQRFSSMDSLEQINAVEPESAQEYREILVLCWQEDISGRPSVKQLRENLARKSDAFSFRHSGSIFIEEVQKRLAGYTRELEDEVALRTKHLVDEMNRCNEIVAQLLPRWVAMQIRAGKPVPAGFFECATLMFTQICGFGNLVKDNAPKTVLDVIAESEMTVDRLIDTFSDEIYKVELVDDCYLVASGLQLTTGARHTQVIAELAIAMQQSTPPLFAQHGLEFKSGIHSGPCAAGIVGFRRLRYCLFGDTVNTASRMCSYGEPSRTHMSAYTTTMVVKTGLFETEHRGVISIKGKDEMTTYWLNGYIKSERFTMTVVNDVSGKHGS